MQNENSVLSEEQIKISALNKETEETKIQPETNEGKQSLMDMLFQEAENFAVESTKKKRESEYEKVKFILKGKEISYKEIRELIVAKALPYSPMFPNDVPFYSEIYRLMGWSDLDPNEYTKPRCVAEITNAIIYRRFPKDVLPSIQALNDYLPNSWVREYKNFQFLNKEGQKQVIVFRNEAIEVMKTCKTMHEFRIKLRTLHNVPYCYQEKLF